ncbi:MAG: exodeoxyribonuclease VII small subunit [Gammaproteobacteria bacterium]|jgi:exodeoxyribonuclease VII small subunit|nr:exodeoxyribonuclease VII small subunit [Gammaproteobacteria bacterium]
MAKLKKNTSFEENMQQIEKIVADLERQSVPLEEAIGLYETGIGLIKNCQKILTEAEQKVRILNDAPHE